MHISVLPFLRFVAARESFRWLRFQLFSRLPGFYQCVCAGQTKRVHIFEFSPQYLFQFCPFSRSIWPHSVSMSTWELCLPIPARKLCCHSFFAMFYEQFWRHFRFPLKCVCSVIIQSFLSFFPRKWWLFTLGDVGLPDLCFIVCLVLLTSSYFFIFKLPENLVFLAAAMFSPGVFLQVLSLISVRYWLPNLNFYLLFSLKAVFTFLSVGLAEMGV